MNKLGFIGGFALEHRQITPLKYNNDKDNSINLNDNRNNIVKALKLTMTRWRTNSNSANQSESRKLFEFLSLTKNIVVIIVWVNDTKKYRLNSSLFILHMFWFLNLFNSCTLFSHFFVMSDLKFPQKDFRRSINVFIYSLLVKMTSISDGNLISVDLLHLSKLSVQLFP